MNLWLVACLLFSAPALAQVTDAPVTTWPTAWRGVVTVATLNPPYGCIAGWTRSTDRYSEWQSVSAFADGTLSPDSLAAIASAVATQNLGALNAMRTEDVGLATKPCTDKLSPRPLAWSVAPISSGRRPAYLLLPDGKRGAQSGTAGTVNSDGTPVRCWCLTRSVETTSSTYCAWQVFNAAPVAPTDPVRVTLCREAK